MTRQERIEMVERNLTHLQSRYLAGKIDKKEYEVIKADGKKAISEIKARPAKDFR